MALSNHERVGKALDLLKDGLKPFVERELKAQHAQLWFEQAKASVSDQQASLFGTEEEPRWDIATLLAVMWNQWQVVFRKTLGQAERTLVSELRDVRNRWAHQNPFSTDDAYRALDSTARLLTGISAPQADEIEKLKMELLRVRFDEQVRHEKRKSAGTAIESQVAGNLKPWREVVNPHKDVASGRYQQAEFAADLWQVHLGEGGDEYRNPVEFFRRTYLTDSLKRLLVGAVQRLSGGGGDPAQLTRLFTDSLKRLLVGAVQRLSGGGGDPAQLTRLFAGAIAHRGFALIDVFSPCVTFNKVNTYPWFKERVYSLEDEKGYDPADVTAAIERSHEWGERIPIGLFYKDEQPIYEDSEPAFRNGPLVDQPLGMGRALFDELMAELM